LSGVAHSLRLDATDDACSRSDDYVRRDLSLTTGLKSLREARTKERSPTRRATRSRKLSDAFFTTFTTDCPNISKFSSLNTGPAYCCIKTTSEVIQVNACWPWQGSVTATGHSCTRMKSPQLVVFRASEEEKGDFGSSHHHDSYHEIQVFFKLSFLSALSSLDPTAWQKMTS